MGACDDGSSDRTVARAGVTPDEAPNLPDADAQADAAADAPCGLTINRERELLVRALPVVEDPVRTTWNGDPNAPVSGAWHFGKLMTHMAGDNDPAVFVLDWIDTWQTAQTVNGQTVPARSAITQIIDAWPKLGNGDLDLTQPPMRLLAIVNRLDLRSDTRAGEGRFVFGVLDGSGNPTQFTVILEYNLPLEVMSAAEWADAWHALGADAPASTAFRNALQDLTDAFAGPDVLPGQVNGSAISQVRSNEIHLSSPWELREFRLNAGGRLRMRTVALTPRVGLNNSTRLADFIDENTEAILAGTHAVPAIVDGVRFRGGRVTNNIDFWNAPGIADPQARHLFSLNTCNGCHGAETNTAFLHVNPRSVGQVASLSGFMTGIDVIDPVDGTTVRSFDDLGRRAADLESLLCESL
ncbi:MAG TPA: hypothetical protein VFG69_08460 [Nannocystaceae bacterium]|nr:hypothetical protein [Nannocystaceae bacterium]